ncbi:MAG: alpha-hydroxy-acid oxidizing protein [Bryobacterales bacterium]|nr:alpha-hydroxy-acid oxidizing protein [Bryobacterales bacterium]
MSRFDPSRRRVLGGLGALAGASLLRGQQDPFRDHSRVPGLDEMVTTLDFEEVFRAKAPREIYDYTSYAAEGEFTLRRNREGFSWVDLVPRGVVDVSFIQTATEILGTKMAYPIMASPTSGHGNLHKDGEYATHQATTEASATPYIVSNASSFPFEKIAAAATGPVWFQLYPRQSVDETREILEKAQAAGCKAVAITMDQQATYYERPGHYRNLVETPGGRTPRRPTFHNPYRVPEGRLWYSWKFLDEIRPFVKVPFFAKGILTAEDAELCIEHGLNGVYVSNHGGRSVDYGPSTLEVLPEIVTAVRGRVPVIIDSGFRSGSDILKALALGASAVCVGRTARWGLGAFGAPGVKRVFEILQAELVMAMAQTGRPTLASIDRTLVKTRFR